MRSLAIRCHSRLSAVKYTIQKMSRQFLGFFGPTDSLLLLFSYVDPPLPSSWIAPTTSSLVTAWLTYIRASRIRVQCRTEPHAEVAIAVGIVITAILAGRRKYSTAVRACPGASQHWGVVIARMSGRGWPENPPLFRRCRSYNTSIRGVNWVPAGATSSRVIEGHPKRSSDQVYLPNIHVIILYADFLYHTGHWRLMHVLQRNSVTPFQRIKLEYTGLPASDVKVWWCEAYSRLDTI